VDPAEQTIFALSSGRPPSAIAIVRVSGRRAATALSAMIGKIPAPRVATRALLRDARRQPIDDALVVWFPAPASATGEDVAEFHVHGGRAVLVKLLAVLADLPELRAAEPGEFTRRAFENGKLDLTEAEALDDLIHADTDWQRRQALRQLRGLLGDRARDWRARIIAVSALIEAGIDFSDEGDVPHSVAGSAVAGIRALLQELDAVLAGEGRSERLRDGLVVAIAGPPNAGKSTLMNQLVRRDVAIVSPHAGTTRDAIEVQLDLEGYPVTVIDTAGIRDTADPVEQEGVRRAQQRAEAADLVLWLADRPADNDRYQGTTPVWRVRNKIDLYAPATINAGRLTGQRPHHGHLEYAISASRGDGLADLIADLALFARDQFGLDDGGLVGRVRQRELLQQTAAALRRSLLSIETGEELAAEDLRMAAYALGKLLGRVDVEDVLDVIFRDFCIGK
jgi:tRNA modification GTPase